jgi:rhamnulokinase
MGYGGSIRFLKNIIGLWILQECRRAWAKAGEDYNYEQLTQMVAAAAPLQTCINFNEVRFAKPDNMLQKITDYCRQAKQPVPTAPGETVRCVLESLALLYRQTLDQLEEVTGRKLMALHIVGGGCKNQLLNQFTANATGRTVVAGPVECTAIGNVLIQAIALGNLPSLESARQVVRNSFPTLRYEPQNVAVWEQAYRKFREMQSNLVQTKIS